MIKKISKLTSLALVLLLGLTACQEKEQIVEEDSHLVDQDKDKEYEKDLSKETKEEKNPSEINEKLAKLYNKVLDDIDSYEFIDIEEGKYSYSYALVKTDDADYPKLLLAQNTDYGISYLKFFSVNDNITDIVYDDEMISIGVAPSGGFRGFISQNSNLDALIYTTFMSGTGEGSQEKITTSIEDASLKLEKEVIWEGRIDTLDPDDSTEIEFSEIDDRDKIYDLASIKDGQYKKTLEEEIENKKDEEVGENTQGPGSSLEDKIQAELDLGNMVARGNVRVFSHADLIEYQKINPLAVPDTGKTYAVLLLDEPIDVTLPSGGGSGPITRNVDMVGLPEDMMAYDGQNIIISFGYNDGF